MMRGRLWRRGPGRRTGHPATPPEPGGAAPDTDLAGVGDVRMVRTFRIGPDGELFPVNSAEAWTDGWNTAICARGHPHAVPDPDCRCGFYAYSDPAYVLGQPPGRQVVAVVAANGPMEVGSRGARLGRARVEAVWVGPRVGEALAAALQRRYRWVRIFRSRTEMDAAYPLTRLAGQVSPRVREPARRRLRAVTWTYIAVVAAVGCLPIHLVVRNATGASLWLVLVTGGFAMVITGVAQRSAVTTLQGVAAIGWLVTAGPASPVQWAWRATLILLMTWVAVIWRRAGTPGRQVHEPRLGLALRRWRGQLPGAR